MEASLMKQLNILCQRIKKLHQREIRMQNRLNNL